jgi:hypothetical protein
MSYQSAYTGQQIDSALATLLGTVNNIGTPGSFGFGVGVAPAAALPVGMTPLSGYLDPTNDNYGNYQFADGSVMCWVPKFYYKVGTGSNGLAVNVIDVKPAAAYTDTAAANTAGYALHRAFIDGGAEQSGFFMDKYMASKNAWGSGFIASSIKNGLPISTASDHNPIGGLTATAGINAYYACLDAAKARDGVNGAKNAASNFFCSSRFIQSALAMLSMAHAQASSTTAACAWWEPTLATAFPKGCNNNALADTNDTTVKFTSDGYSNCGKTGSGVPFAKTTHNGQNCGVADVNGLLYEVNPGLTCIATTKAISAVTQANPAVVTSVALGLANGIQILITGVVGMTQLNDCIHTVANVTADTFELAGVNSTAYGAYTSGGTITRGTFYVLKQSAAMKNITSGNTLAGDHWGATAAAAQFDVIAMPFINGGIAQRFGSGANQVLSEATSGDPWVLSGLGFPKASTGISSAGINLFGADYFYQYFINDMVPISCLSWSSTTYAGVWSVYLSYARSHSHYSVGFRCACYPAG